MSGKVITKSFKPKNRIYGHPDLGKPENWRINPLQPIGHKGVVSSNQVLQHIRFAITRLETAKIESVLENAPNHLGSWNMEIDEAIEILERVIVGERKPKERLIPRSADWVRHDESAA